MKKIFIGLLALAITGFANASPEDAIKNKFTLLQKNYFLKLDLRAPAQELSTIPTFAATFHALADEQRTLLATSKTLTTEDKELAGLVLIYDAMLNSNITIGILNGKLSLADFTKETKFAKLGATQHEELLARARYSISTLKLAATLRPNDRRIDSWVVGAKGGLENIEFGKLSKATQAAIIKSISVRPSFNLWTAILLLHNEPQSSKHALVKSAKNFVDAASEGKDACTLHPDDCNSTWKAPYNFQAAVTELGDVFLQQAEYELKKGNIKNAMMMAGYAAGTYKQLSKPEHLEISKLWPDYNVLAMRETRLRDIEKQKVPATSMHTINDYQQPYECASCHGRVRAIGLKSEH